MFGTITLNSFEGFKGFSHSGGVMSLPPDPPHYYYGYKNNLTRINQHPEYTWLDYRRLLWN